MFQLLFIPFFVTFYDSLRLQVSLALGIPEFILLLYTLAFVLSLYIATEVKAVISFVETGIIAFILRFWEKKKYM